jgi:hypothetical protein
MILASFTSKVNFPLGIEKSCDMAFACSEMNVDCDASLHIMLYASSSRNGRVLLPCLWFENNSRTVLSAVVKFSQLEDIGRVPQALMILYFCTLVSLWFADSGYEFSVAPLKGWEYVNQLGVTQYLHSLRTQTGIYSATSHRWNGSHQYSVNTWNTRKVTTACGVSSSRWRIYTVFHCENSFWGRKRMRRQSIGIPKVVHDFMIVLVLTITATQTEIVLLTLTLDILTAVTHTRMTLCSRISSRARNIS